MPPERGVFLSETRRMHPDVCRFISEQIYESRLVSYPDCANQSTEFGTGLRWLSAVHAQCSTESEEEVKIVTDEISRLMGSIWTDMNGVEAPLTTDDFMVVAPYNDQVHMLRDYLESDRRTQGVRVGTVDKFQGKALRICLATLSSCSRVTASTWRSAGPVVSPTWYAPSSYSTAEPEVLRRCASSQRCVPLSSTAARKDVQ